MKTKSTYIRISQLNKKMLEKYVIENYKQEYPVENKISQNDLIGYLIKKNLGIYYSKIKFEVEIGIFKHNKRK